MKLFESHYKNNYEELITYYPVFYREVYEMVEILKAQGRLADNLQNSIEQVFSNQFIDSADESVISSYEKIMGIIPDSLKPIEERRRLVKARLIGSGKISASVISDMIKAYTGGEAKCSLEPFDSEGNNKLYINAERGNSPQIYLQEVENLLSEKIPAHIEYELSFGINAPIYLSCEVELYNTDLPLCGLYSCGQIPFSGGV